MKSPKPMFAGPKRVSFKVTVHDDVMQASGCRCYIEDVLERWRKSQGRAGTPFSGCYVMPLNDLSFNDDICQYNGLNMSPSLPVAFKLAFFDPSMAEAYHEEHKRIQYKAMRFSLSEGRADQLNFPPLSKLEDDSKKHIHAAALRCDRGLNQEQLEVIQSVLCGWATKETPNGTISLNVCPVAVKDYLRSMGTISAADLKWWGSRSCFVEGPPGTGKTRMLAALIAVILQNLETQLRVLIVCETNKALGDIFISVLKLFQGAGCRDRHLKSMVRIGHSKLKVVSNREVHHLRGRSSCDAVDKARAVFTTFGSAYRHELSGSSRAFSVVLFEESCLVKQSLALHALTIAYCRPSAMEGDFRRATMVCIGDSKQLHEEDYVNIPVSRKASQHFFNRVFEKDVMMRGNIRMGLRRQYRMNPALAEYISKQFYDGTLLTEAYGSLPWKDDSIFRALRRHRRFPIRNVTVVDTSMEGRSGIETIGAGRSYYNSMEVNVIAQVLKAWRDDVGALEIASKVSIITTYVRQKEELVNTLNAEQLFLPVHTIDEFQGGENDIVIISLVRARSTSADNMELAYSNESAIGFVSRNERVNVALSRAKQGCMVIGNVKHIARHCKSLRNFFAECAQKSNGEEQGSHGYYRLRYVDFKRHLRFSEFTPSYVP